MADARDALAEGIAARLAESSASARAQWQASAPIRHCVIDALLPEAEARALAARFPPPAQMRLRNTFRERKWVSAQMDRHDPQLEAALFAFHAPSVVAAVRAMVGKADLHPDPQLYAGGLSVMGRGHFLNPHIDNSHDAQRARWRNLNLLYYLGPEDAERDEGGGELELWPQGVAGAPLRIAACFNRLVIMETHDQAWHSVRPITREAPRLCLSNYYFGDTPMRAAQRFHVTRFRARPGQPLRDALSRADGALRLWLRRAFKDGLGRQDHRYRR